MSNEILMKQEPLVAPADSDEQFLIRLEYEDPIRKASIWLHKLIVHRIRDVQLATPWYLGKTDEPPEQLLSDLFSQTDGRFCRRFDYFCRMVKKYRQGEVPRSIIEDDNRAVGILVAALSRLSENAETLRLFTRRIREFVSCVTMCDGGRMLRRDYLARIDSLAESIVTISGRIGDEFRRIENVRRGEISEPATKADLKPIAALASDCKSAAESSDRKTDVLLSVVGETAQTVKRIDRRGKKDNRRRRFTLEQQEQCFRYWELGRQSQAIKENTRNKVKYEHVFAYYRKELKALGIRDNDDFISALGARSDRICRVKSRQ